MRLPVPPHAHYKIGRPPESRTPPSTFVASRRFRLTSSPQSLGNSVVAVYRRIPCGGSKINLHSLQTKATNPCGCGYCSVTSALHFGHVIAQIINLESLEDSNLISALEVRRPIQLNDRLSENLVPDEGVEPPIPKASVSKTDAYTNSANRALKLVTMLPVTCATPTASSNLVRRARLELACTRPRVLSPLRLPIPPAAHRKAGRFTEPTALPALFETARPFAGYTRYQLARLESGTLAASSRHLSGRVMRARLQRRSASRPSFKIGCSDRTRTYTVPINSGTSYQLDHATAETRGQLLRGLTATTAPLSETCSAFRAMLSDVQNLVENGRIELPPQASDARRLPLSELSTESS